MKSILVASLLCLTCAPLAQTVACSTLMAGRRATNDGSVLMSHSCDGDVMGLVYVMPAQAVDVLLTTYARDCTSQTGSAYQQLVDYLMLHYLIGEPEFARSAPPRIAAPTIPEP